MWACCPTPHPAGRPWRSSVGTVNNQQDVREHHSSSGAAGWPRSHHRALLQGPVLQDVGPPPWSLHSPGPNLSSGTKHPPPSSTPSHHRGASHQVKEGRMQPRQAASSQVKPFLPLPGLTPSKSNFAER